MSSFKLLPPPLLPFLAMFLLWQPNWAQQNHQHTSMVISHANHCSCSGGRWRRMGNVLLHVLPAGMGSEVPVFDDGG